MLTPLVENTSARAAPSTTDTTLLVASASFRQSSLVVALAATKSTASPLAMPTPLTSTSSSWLTTATPDFTVTAATRPAVIVTSGMSSQLFSPYL